MGKTKSDEPVQCAGCGKWIRPPAVYITFNCRGTDYLLHDEYACLGALAYDVMADRIRMERLRTAEDYEYEYYLRYKEDD